MNKVISTTVLSSLLAFPISQAEASAGVALELGKAESINISTFKDKLKVAADKTTRIMKESPFSIDVLYQGDNFTNSANTAVDKTGNIINKLNGEVRNFLVEGVLYQTPYCPNNMSAADPRCENSKMIRLTQIEKDVVVALGYNSNSSWLKLNLKENNNEMQPQVSYSKEDVTAYWSSNLFNISNIVITGEGKSEISIFIDEANSKAALTPKNDVLEVVKYMVKRDGGKFVKNIYTAPSGSIYNIKLVNDKVVLVKVVKNKPTQASKAVWYPSKSNKVDGKLVISNVAKSKDNKVISYEFVIFNGAVVSSVSRNGNEIITTNFSLFEDIITVPVLEIIDLNLLRENDLFKAKMVDAAALAQIEHDKQGAHEHSKP
jgi:hypothetical protein